MKFTLPLVALAICIPASLANLVSESSSSGLRSLLSGDCEICSSDNKDRPDSLTLQYVSTGLDSRYQNADKASCRAGIYPWSTTITMTNKGGVKQSFVVTSGDIFTIAGPFNAETNFQFDGCDDCYIHTSCSVPLIAGDQIGAFKVLAGNNCPSGVTEQPHIPCTDGTPVGTCEICSKDNKDTPDFLMVEYKPAGVNSQFQGESKASCRAGSYPTTTSITVTNKDGITQTFSGVSEGDMFSIQGPFDTMTTFQFDGCDDCYFHTSCSSPLVTNDQIGPFKLLAGNECHPDPEETVSTDPPQVSTDPPQQSEEFCEICSSDNKNKPDSLTLEYQPIGINSLYQDSGKASCRAGMYPTTTRITTENKNGIRQTFDVTAGDKFTIAGPFSAETTFKYDGGDCYIHTSCSVPLITSDQIGPFVVTAGNECGTPTTTVPPTDGTPEGMCEICSKDNKDKPEFLVIEYMPVGVNSMYQDESKASCRAGSYPATTTITTKNKDGTTQTFPGVSAGDVFTIQGPFNAETSFSYDGGECYIHTSCSAPLVTNDQIGPFKMLAGNECNADPPTNTIPPVQTEVCEICSSDNKNKPDSLTLTYQPTGMNSLYQDSGKASCRAGTYPATTTLSMENKNGIRQTFDVTAGDAFTISGPFSAETVFTYSGGNCYIHTSCSVPLITGDQIGPFVVTAGNECGTPPPVVPPTNEGTCEICSKDNKDKPEFLVIEYVPIGVNSQYQDESKASCRAGSYPATTTITMTNKEGNTQIFPGVSAGDVFTILGPFNANTEFTYGTGDCSIHTSCSAPLVTNDQIGPFKVLAGNECLADPPTSPPTHPPTPPPFDLIVTSPPTPPPPPTLPPTLPPTRRPIQESEECEICSNNNGETPDRITLVYKSEGQDSVFQNDKKATCGAGSYPQSASIVYTNDDGVLFVANVVDGDSFEIIGPFKDKQTFSLGGTSTQCYITLSCKVQLVVGDQIGPFLIVEGGDNCKYETLPPSIPPSDSPTPPPTGAPSPSPSGTPSAPPTPPPTGAPSPSPSAPPSPAPSESPSMSIPPTRAPCIKVNKDTFVLTETIEVDYNIDIIPENPLTNNGWICVYPCFVTDYFNAYHFKCGNIPGNCIAADSSGEVNFSTGGDACSTNDQRWPLAPTFMADGSINTCNKVVIVRTTTTTDEVICVSDPFTVVDTVEECEHRAL